MPIPNQDISTVEGGIGVIESLADRPLVMGTASKGALYGLKSFRRKTDVIAEHDEGPLPEALCKALDIAGGPVLGMRLPSTVVGTIGATTTTRVSATSPSTGTVTGSVTPATATQAWQIDDPAGTPSYVDETADLASSTTADVDVFPDPDAVGDQFAIGYTTPFNEVTLTLSTPGVGGTIAVKYWDGSAWSTVSGLTDGTSNLTSSGSITFTMPTDWAARSINGGPQLFFLVLEVATDYTTVPVATSGTIGRQGPHDGYEIHVEVLKTGTLGAGTFRYSLDDATSWSEELIVPSGGTFDVPNTGVRLTFAAGAGPTYFEDGDLFEIDCVAPYFAAADLTPAANAILADSTEFDFIGLLGKPASASDAATLFASVETHAASLENAHRYVGWIMDFGSGDTVANVKTNIVTVENRRVMPVYGETDLASSKARAGWTSPKRSGVEILFAWAADQLISTDLARKLSGSLPGVTKLSHDEFLNEELDAFRLTTFRTWLGSSGFYVTNGRLKSGTGSDFRYWQHLRINNAICRTVYLQQQNFISAGVRTNADGSIDERDAVRYERRVNRALQALLTQPDNAEGTRGHVSAISYQIDRANDINTSETLQSEVAWRPLAYPKQIVTKIGQSLQV